LRPDRWDVVIDKIHEKTGHDKAFIKDLIKFYWKKFREAMMNTKHYCIDIKGVGTMTMKSNSAEVLRERYQGVLQEYPTNTIGMFKKKQRIEETVKNLEHAIELYKKDREKFIKVMEKRYGKYTPNLEKQKKYLRGY
jgi:hypothetical protein